jgi:hypothetical protein
VDLITLPDNGDLNTISFKHSAPCRYWRIRPTAFNGEGCDNWRVKHLELIDFMATAPDNIEDKIFLENRNRDYADQPIMLKGHYEMADMNSELTKFGIDIPSMNLTLKINFISVVDALARPLVIGDVIELPSQAQFNAKMQRVKKFFEVTDVTWDSGSFTPAWVPTSLQVSIQPLLASQETQDIFGSFVGTVDESGLFSIPTPPPETNYQKLDDITQTILAEHKTALPQRGDDLANTVREFTPEEVQTAKDTGFVGLLNMQPNSKALYVEDGLPPNGLPYTEGTTYPELPKDGDYHRLIYVGTAEKIAPRLYRYSLPKTRWIYMETDRRQQYQEDKPTTESLITSKTSVPARTIK